MTHIILLSRCTVNNSTCFSSLVCCVLHPTDHSNAAPEKNVRSTDSDNEEFCDSMEHLAMEEV